MIGILRSEGAALLTFPEVDSYVPIANIDASVRVCFPKISVIARTPHAYLERFPREGK